MSSCSSFLFHWWKPQFTDPSDDNGWYYFIPPELAVIPHDVIPLQQPPANVEPPAPQLPAGDQVPVLQHPNHQQVNIPAVGRPQRQTRVPDRLGVQQYDEDAPLQGELDVTARWWPGYPRNQD